MTHPGAPRDVDLPQWLDGIGFKPANTERKQLGHEVARQIVGEFGGLLHSLLPAGRDKSLAFTLLEDVLMRANRALALGDGPPERLTVEFLRDQARQGVQLPQDPRIEKYKAEQRGEPVQEPLPDDFGAHQYDSTVTTDDPEIKVDIHSSTTSGRVQLGVLCTNPQRVEDQFIASGNDQGVTFDGFYAGFTASDQLSAFLRELDAAGKVAFQDSARG